MSKCVAFFLVFLFLLGNIPNPWSTEYEFFEIEQAIQWQDVSDLFQAKNKILAQDSSKVKLDQIEVESSINGNVILLYTTIFQSHKYCRFTSERIFGDSCPTKNRCRWSCDRRDLSIADAIIFHAYDIQYFHASLPDRSQCKSTAVWILWSDEPPSIINYTLFNQYKFNWTVSYKLTSEVSIGTYGLFKKKTEPLTDEEFNRWIDHEFYQRDFGVLWFVSNCDSKQRLNYFHQLKEAATIHVEGYGRCVDHYLMHWCQRYTVCEKNYMERFKFYLSFESIDCQDYVTEKFYKAFYYGLIPIVYGPERRDYERVAPKDSFIHLNDYKNDMIQMAHRLENIYSDRNLFSSFHRWRKNYEVVIDPHALDRIRMCELCERLNDITQRKNSYYDNLSAFYDQGCML